ncbi:MAG TPA: Sir2 family NAD-dependent protein deacetylase, partial [Archangium sp.]
METLRIDEATRLLVVTGAGVSAESGIPTYRGSNGLWENHPVEWVASPEGFRDDPVRAWRFYSQRRAGMGPCEPNPGHLAIAAWEKKLGNRFLLATQNVDGLHRK